MPDYGLISDTDAGETTAPWYPQNDKIKKVVIEEGVTRIGVSAFDDCPSLTSVTIPNSVKSIGDEAFYGCVGITSLTIPGSVTSIGKRTFSLCSSLSSISFEGKKHPDMWENTFENVKRTIPV